MPCISLPKLYHTAELFYLLVKIMSSHFRNFDTVTKTRHKEIPNLENMQVIFLKNSFISTLIDFFSSSIIHQETLATLFLLWDIANHQDDPCSQYHELAMQSRRVLSFYSTADTTQTMSQSQILFFHVWWPRIQLWSILVWASTLGLIVML